MNKKLYILVSSYSLTGPTKGAIALANGLSKHEFDITLIFFKKYSKSKLNLTKTISVIYLENTTKSFFKKINYLNDIINNFSNVISFGFMADMVNVIFLKKNISISSVRGNLYKNYTYDFNFFGKILAYFHYKIIGKANYIFSMTYSMQKRVKDLTGRDSLIIRNFIDEISLKDFNYKKKFNKNIIKLVFIGTLSKRKNVIFLLKIFKKLLNSYNLKLNIVGDGPLKSQIINYINENKLNDFVKFHGFKKNPYSILLESDIFLLPSFSEGLSRASLEALFFNLPCVMFKVDGNEELIKNNYNGFLSKSEEDYMELLKKCIDNIENLKKNRLLPKEFTQREVSLKIKNFINEQ